MIILTTGETTILTKSAIKVLKTLIQDIPENRLQELAMSQGYDEDEAFFTADELKRAFNTKVD